MILESLTERITRTTIKHKRQETRDTNNFHRGNRKGEKPANSLEIESTPKVKPENIKMISQQQ